MPRLTAVRSAGLLALLCFIISCGGSDEPNGPGAASSIAITPEHPSLKQLNGLQLTATVRDADGKLTDDQTVIWASSDPGKLNVSSDGIVASAGPHGSYTIAATQGLVSNSITVDVYQDAGSIRVSDANVALVSGESWQLSAAVLDLVGDTIAGLTPTFSGSNAVYTVSSSGLVTSLGPAGEGTVQVTSGTTSANVGVYVGSVPLGTVLRTLTLEGAPYAAAVSPTGRMIVSRAATGTVVAGDLPAFTFPDTIDIGVVQPLGVTMNPAGTKAYVGLHNGLGVIDLATDVFTHPLSDTQVGQIFSLAVSGDGSRLYASTVGSYRVYGIATANYAVTDSSAAFTVIEQVAIHPTQPLVYAVNINEAYELNSTTLATVRTFPTAGGKGVAVAPDGSALYISNDAGGMKVVNLANGNVTIVPTSPSFGVLVRGNQVVLSGDSRVQFIDRSTLTILKSVLIGSINRRPGLAPNGTVVVPDESGQVIFIR